MDLKYDNEVGRRGGEKKGPLKLKGEIEVLPLFIY